MSFAMSILMDGGFHSRRVRQGGLIILDELIRLVKLLNGHIMNVMVYTINIFINGACPDH